MSKPRVAYCINGHQPVESTHIGRDPLFYMDSDPIPAPIHGHAFCDCCDGVRPYHVMQGEEPACPPELRAYSEFICNVCDAQLMITFYPAD